MSLLVRGESVGLLSAIESSFGVQPTTGWRQHQFNPGGLKGLNPAEKRAARNPITPYRANFKGDIIDINPTPSFDHDLNKDLLDDFAPGFFYSAVSYSGTTSSSTPGKFFPTAVTSSQFTIPTAFAVTQNMLVYARGFINTANNGLFVVQSGSTTTAIMVTGTVAETPPANATVEIVGFQFTATDLVVTNATTLTTTTQSVTALNIPNYSWLWVGGGTAAAPGSLGFATAGDRGFIRITGQTLHTITFDRSTQAWSADAGTGKTVQLFFGWFVANQAFNSASYLETTYQLEGSFIGLDSGAATDYIYAPGCYPDMWSMNAAALNKIVTTLSFKSQDVQNPTLTRATGASTALAPLASSMFNVVTELPRLRVADKSSGNYNASISVDIDNWKLDLKNNIVAQKQQGFFGMKRGIVGKCDVSVAIKAFLVQNDMILAMRDNRDLMFEAMLRNNDAGCVWDLPRCEISGGALDIPANNAVTISETLNAVYAPTEGFVIGMTMFPYLPAT